MTFQLENNIRQLQLLMMKCGLTIRLANFKILRFKVYGDVKVEDRLSQKYEINLISDAKKVNCEIFKKNS